MASLRNLRVDCTQIMGIRSMIDGIFRSSAVLGSLARLGIFVANPKVLILQRPAKLEGTEIPKGPTGSPLGGLQAPY